MNTLAKCSVWGVLGTLLGFAMVAYGQDPAAPVLVADDPAFQTIWETGKALGLPGIMTILGFWLRGAMKEGVPVAPVHLAGPVELSRKSIVAIAKAIKKLDDEDTSEDTDPK